MSTPACLPKVTDLRFGDPSTLRHNGFTAGVEVTFDDGAVITVRVKDYCYPDLRWTLPDGSSFNRCVGSYEDRVPTLDELAATIDYIIEAKLAVNTADLNYYGWLDKVRRLQLHAAFTSCRRQLDDESKAALPSVSTAAPQETSMTTPLAQLRIIDFDFVTALNDEDERAIVVAGKFTFGDNSTLTVRAHSFDLTGLDWKPPNRDGELVVWIIHDLRRQGLANAEIACGMNLARAALPELRAPKLDSPPNLLLLSDRHRSQFVSVLQTAYCQLSQQATAASVA